jgi:GNAT superfamily N-acetyltransferase
LGNRPEGFAAFAAASLGRDGIVLRAATADDTAFIEAVYASTREDELRPVAWDAARKKAFTDWQSRLQEEHYAAHYPHAERLVIEVARAPVGRIYVDVTAADVRLMEVTLLPGHRSLGIGTRLMDALLAYADALGRQVSLHVEPFNPVRRLYARLGFATQEMRGLYEFMVRPARPGVPSRKCLAE